jgi:transcriptional activator of cad operon
LDQFKLKHLLVDVQRCQIIDHDKTRSVEPRSMDVLAFLANHPGKVISQQQLFDALWPDTVFSPGAIQRCVAQLRKAMGDNAHHPVFISTHSKRGYCLDVQPVSKETSLTKGQIKKATWLVVSLLAVIWLYAYQPQVKQAKLIGKLTPITSTSNYDFFPSYSSDGKKLAFIRQQGNQTHIYLKDMVSGAVSRLTNKSQRFLSLVWSFDNQSIVFVVREHDADWVGQQSLHTVNTEGLFRIEDAADIWRVFTKDKALYYMLVNVAVNKKPMTKIRRYDPETKAHADLLLSSDEFTPYRIAMSPDKKSFAIAGESPENKIEFRLFTIPKHELSEPFATLPLGFTEINWHPDGQSLLVHHLNQLFSLTLEGQFVKLPYNNFQRFFNPTYHPDGHQVLISLTEEDTDLVTFNPQSEKLDTLIDSDGEDHLARFSPNGQSIAFVSSRTGTQQLFMWNKGHDINIFTNPDNLPIYRAPVWAKRGDRFTFSFANKLFIYNINTKSLDEIDMPATFTAVLDWYSNDSQLLIATKKDNISYLSQYDLDTQNTSDLIESGVNYSARLSNTDQLVFHKDGVIHWGQRIFLLEDLLEISGMIYPVENELIFRSGRQIIRFDGLTYTVLVNELPQDVISIADVLNKNNFLLNSSSSQSAKIVALE